MYYCSDGERVSEATIQARYSKSIREKYAGQQVQMCRGCGIEHASGSAHIVPKAILKQMHMTELIWNPIMYFPACHRCNRICENVSSIEITKLNNYFEIKSVMEKYAPLRALKLLA